jgi:hypothetical protein
MRFFGAARNIEEGSSLTIDGPAKTPDLSMCPIFQRIETVSVRVRSSSPADDPKSAFRPPHPQTVVKKRNSPLASNLLRIEVTAPET